MQDCDRLRYRVTFGAFRFYNQENGQLAIQTVDFGQGLVVLRTWNHVRRLDRLAKPYFATIALLTIAIRSFCRFYYFAFYVIQHYVDNLN
jgi:hypothetical protein